MRPAFEIGNSSVKPGTRETVLIPISRLADHTDMMLKALVVHGKGEGPSARRFMAMKLSALKSYVAFRV